MSLMVNLRAVKILSVSSWVRILNGVLISSKWTVSKSASPVLWVNNESHRSLNDLGTAPVTYSFPLPQTRCIRNPLASILTITNVPVITTILLISHTRTLISESSLYFFLTNSSASLFLSIHTICI